MLLSFVSLTNLFLVWTKEDLYVTEGSSIDLACETENQSAGRWKFEEDILYVNRLQFTHNFPGSMTLSTDYSLIIESVQLVHEGTYSCYISDSTTTIYVLVVIGILTYFRCVESRREVDADTSPNCDVPG